MVLWGQSAGARAVMTYSYANPDDPIVTGLIADSGSASAVSTNTTSCANLTAAAELTCMQAVDAFAIQTYVQGSDTRIGGLIPDNVTVFANNTERLIQGRITQVVCVPQTLFLRHN
jgi:carboxylesterase type B